MVKKEGNVWRVQVQRGGVMHSTTRPTKREAEAFKAKVIEDHRNKRAGKVVEYTVRQAFEKYILETVTHQKADKKTINHVRQLYPFIGLRPITELNDVWQDYIRWASKERTVTRYGVEKIIPPASNATMNRKGAALRRMANLAYRTWGWLQHPIHIELLPETVGKKAKVTIRVADFPEFIRHVPDEESKAMMMVLMYTGMRIGEALKLTVAEDGYFTLLDTKNNTEHRIKIHPALEPYLKYIPFTYAYHYYYDRFVIAREAIGRPDLTPHKLRHSFATHLLNQGERIEVVSKLLNHSDISITMKHYGDVYREVLDSAIDNF